MLVEYSQFECEHCNKNVKRQVSNSSDFGWLDKPWLKDTQHQMVNVLLR